MTVLLFTDSSILLNYPPSGPFNTSFVNSFTIHSPSLLPYPPLCISCTYVAIMSCTVLSVLSSILLSYILHFITYISSHLLFIIILCSHIRLSALAIRYHYVMHCLTLSLFYYVSFKYYNTHILSLSNVPLRSHIRPLAQAIRHHYVTHCLTRSVFYIV